MKMKTTNEIRRESTAANIIMYFDQQKLTDGEKCLVMVETIEKIISNRTDATPEKRNEIREYYAKRILKRIER